MNTRGRWQLRAILLFVCLAVLANGCKELKRAFTVPDVLLRVSDTSCATATVRWGDGSNETEQVVELPWSRDIGTASGLILILTARRECEDGGTITAEVYLDGDLEDRGTAAGPNAVAGASAGFL